MTTGASRNTHSQSVAGAAHRKVARPERLMPEVAATACGCCRASCASTSSTSASALLSAGGVSELKDVPVLDVPADGDGTALEVAHLGVARLGDLRGERLARDLEVQLDRVAEVLGEVEARLRGVRPVCAGAPAATSIVLARTVIAASLPTVPVPLTCRRRAARGS